MLFTVALICFANFSGHRMIRISVNYMVHRRLYMLSDIFDTGCKLGLENTLLQTVYGTFFNHK